MKKIILLLPILIIIFSCEQDKLIYNGDDFVGFRLTSNQYSVIESREGALTLALSSEAKSDLTINLEVNDSTAVRDMDYTIPNSVVIPSGQKSVEIPITTVNDEDENGLRVFELIITSVSDSNIKIGIEDEGSYSKVVRIIDDDCPTRYVDFIGNIRVKDSDSGSTVEGTADATQDGECDLLVINAHLLPSLSEQDSNKQFALELFPAPGTEGKFGDVNVPQTIVLRDAQEDFEIEDGVFVNLDLAYSGSGTYNAEEGIIEIQYDAVAINQSSGEPIGNFWNGTTTITTNNQ
ncbi:hypothetical protein [Mesonia maritima]|uniref:Calx-beta domain-containing protein n=1 Tax=Mesonia maritima TaxID=1793873 RepID=A0ABU1K7S9_9FLAO|nr:hypothetical protein [Mesonia maritima]MDR6301356.1 hypothetical protein [Mesonia maritima]